MAKVLKKGVTVDKATKTINIDQATAGVKADTIYDAASKGYNVNYTSFGKGPDQPGTPKLAPTPSPIKPVVSPTLQAKIDAKKQTPGAAPVVTTPPVTTPVDNKPAPPVDAVEQAALDAQNQPNGDQPPEGYTYGSTMDSSTGKPELIKNTPTETTPPAETPAPVVPPTPETTEPPKTTVPTDQKIEPSDVEKNAQASGVKYTMDEATGQPIYNPSTKEEALKVLQMGGKIQGESKLNAVAQNTLNKVRNLSQMTDKQLSQNIVNGSVSPKELELLNQVNPDLVKRAQDFATKSNITNTTNAIQSDNAAIANGQEAPIQNTALNTLLQKVQQLDADKETYGEIKKRVYEQYPEMDQAREDIVSDQTKLRELQRAKRALYDDYKAQNSSLPISMIQAGFSALSRAIDDQIYVTNDALSQNVAIYNSYLDDAQAEIKWEVDQQGADEDRLWKMYGVTRAEEVRSEDIQREDERINKDIALEEYRYQRALEDGNTIRAEERKNKLADLKEERDYNLANALKTVGIDPTGMTSEEMSAYYADAMGKQIQKEDAYKAATLLREEKYVNEDGSEGTRWVNPLTGQAVTPEQTFGPEAADAEFEKVLAGYSQKGQELLLVPDGTVIPTRLGEVSPQNASIRGKECAEYVNDIAGTKMGSTFDSKAAVCNEPTGGVGSIVAWKPNGSGNFGHTGIIVDQDADNYYVKSSNYTPGTVTTEKIPKGNIKNFYTPDSVKQVQAASQEAPAAKKYANGNIRTADGVLIKKEDAYKINKDVINDKSYEALKASEDMITAWNSYKKLVEDKGLEIYPGAGKGEMETAYNGVLRAAQKFFALGVFQPYDQKAIEKMIPNYAPGNLASGGIIASTMGTGGLAQIPLRSSLKGKTKGFDDFIQNKIQNEYESLNSKYGEFGDTLTSMQDVNRIYSNIDTVGKEKKLVDTY